MARMFFDDEDEKCTYCGELADCPPLKKETLKEVGGLGDNRCLTCCESRLGRGLTLNDLRPCLVTKMIVTMASRVQSDISD